MGKKNPQDQIEQMMEDAREDFDLRDRLTGRSPRLTETVTVYTDAVTGKELGGNDEIIDRGIHTGQYRRWGVLGQIGDLGDRIEHLLKRAEDPITTDEAKEGLLEQIEPLEKELATLKRRAKTLAKKLDETALVFTLQALPEIITRDAHRQARKTLDIKGKGVPNNPDIQEQYDREYEAIVLAGSVQEWSDKSDGKTRYSLSVQQAKDLKNYLPIGQFSKLDAAVVDLSYRAQIGNHATDSADFLRGT